MLCFTNCRDFSKCVSFSTSGSIPSQPDPPMLAEQYVRALVISWIKRISDDEFTLQMEDESTVSSFTSFPPIFFSTIENSLFLLIFACYEILLHDMFVIKFLRSQTDY